MNEHKSIGVWSAYMLARATEPNPYRVVMRKIMRARAIEKIKAQPFFLPRKTGFHEGRQWTADEITSAMTPEHIAAQDAMNRNVRAQFNALRGVKYGLQWERIGIDPASQEGGRAVALELNRIHMRNAERIEAQVKAHHAEQRKRDLG